MGRVSIRSACATCAVLLASSSVAAQPVTPEPPPPAEHWTDIVELGAFADAYFGTNWDFPKPQKGPNRVTRGFDSTNGFAMSWVGLDARVQPEPVGGLIQLRFGPSAAVYAGPDESEGLENVKQAFASWRPGGADGSVTLDFGKFDTPYGGEVGDVQDNRHYTTGIMYWLTQPRFHTGLRATWDAADWLGVTGLVVNGWNRSVDNNTGKSFGAAARLRIADGFTVDAGWLGGPEQDDSTSLDCPVDTAYDPDARGCAPAPGTRAATYTVDRGNANDVDAWRHLFDAVVRLDVTSDLNLVLDGTYGMEGARRVDSTTGEISIADVAWYGAGLSARYQLTETYAVALRGEYVSDADGWARGVDGLELATGTLTLEATPTENLILRLDARGDFALGADDDGAEKIFTSDVRENESRLLTTTLGVIVKTN